MSVTGYGYAFIVFIPFEAKAFSLHMFAPIYYINNE